MITGRGWFSPVILPVHWTLLFQAGTQSDSGVFAYVVIILKAVGRHRYISNTAVTYAVAYTRYTTSSIISRESIIVKYNSYLRIAMLV